MQDTVRDWARAAGVRAVKTAAQAAVVWLKQGIDSCMNQFN